MRTLQVRAAFIPLAIGPLALAVVLQMPLFNQVADANDRQPKGLVGLRKTAYAPVCTSLWGTVYHEVGLSCVGGTRGPEGRLTVTTLHWLGARRLRRMRHLGR
jgi:hypothetical protein